ncbi:MAG: FecR domain-containing protein, partial [Nitrospinaceae bacterium]|nr:FecR domain-containing protein [Nitrospinaceae bacterium]
MHSRRITRKLTGFLVCSILALGVSNANAANNAADLAMELAKALKVSAANAPAALKALQGRGIIPVEVFSGDPVTSNVAQTIATGLIKSGIKPPEAAKTLAAAAAAASVPLQDAVQGAVKAAIAAGADVAAVTKAASEGAVKGSTAQVSGPMTKGRYIKRNFLNKDTRSDAAAAYVPKGKANFEAVVAEIAAKGENSFAGSKASDPLTRADFLTLRYLQVGGKPGAVIGDKKRLLKKKGLIASEDIGQVKSFQGDATLTHPGSEKSIKITGNEAILYKDVGETELDARIELLFDDGSTLTISEDTALTIDEMIYNPKTKYRSIKLRVKSGTIHVKTAKNSNPKSKFSIVTPTVVAGLRGTDVYMNVTPTGASRVTSNTGANAGNVVMRAATVSDRPPPATTPTPGTPPLAATPAQAPPGVTVTPGNGSSAAPGATT